MNDSAKVLCLFIGLILSTQTVFANALAKLEVDLHFRELKQNDKLSQLVINDIVQDDDGFVWIATDDGLNRLDGIDNQIYRPLRQASGTISHFVINRLVLDRQGILWVGTENGLNQYDAQNDRFALFSLPEQHQYPLTDKKIRALFIDQQNRLWLGTKTGGVDVIAADRLSFQHFELADPDLKGKPLYIHDFLQTADGTIWVASKRGLLRVDPLNQSLNIVAATEGKNIMQLAALADYSLLIGSSKGLFRYYVDSNQWQAILPQQLQNRQIVTLTKVKEDSYFLGTRNNGLYLFDLNSQSLRHFSNDPTAKNTLLDNQIGAVYQARDGLFWIGTNIGVNLYNPLEARFGHISSSKEDPNCLSGNTIYAVLVDRSRRLWVAAFGQGLNRIDLSSGRCDALTDIHDGRNVHDLKNVVALHEDAKGDIWIGTFGAGVIKYEAKNDRFSRLNPMVNPLGAVLPMAIQAISSDDKGQIWIATYDAGIFRYRSATDDLAQYFPQSPQQSTTKIKEINDLTVDAQGQLWIATATEGLWHFNPERSIFKHIEGVPDLLWSVDFDSQQQLWIGSAGKGAVKYNPETGFVWNYTRENGLLNNVVLNIREDKQGYLWLFTDKGLSRLNPRDHRIRNFLEQDGLQSDTFTTAGYFDGNTGIMWTGGVNGFNRFNPIDILPSAQQQKVLLTKFELFYRPLPLASEWPESPLTQSMSHLTTINLKHDQNVFAFGFSALEFVAPEHIQYAFKLEGSDQSWNIVDADRRYANYTNIDPGKYIFRVKATNRDGQWSDKETQIEIVIDSPWWATKTALAGYVLISLLSLYLLVEFRTRRLSQRTRALSKAVAQRTQELATEKQKVEQLLTRKNEEFVTVSHEFRTPLTLILGPVAQLLQSTTNTVHKNRLALVQRNAYRLLRMVEQLLNLETFKVQAINQTASRATGPIIRLICEAFADVAGQKQLKLEFDHICDANCELIADGLEKILLNLLSNAVKYTPAGGTITLLSQPTSDNLLNIKVADSGCGIPTDKLDSVFERYQRVLGHHSEHVSGAGIGLALVKSLVEVQHGRIEIHSELGKGTTIDLYFPIVASTVEKVAPIELNAELLAMEFNSIAQSSQTTPSAPPITSAIGRQPLVLVVEDNQDMAHYICESIEPNYQVITASDGQIGLSTAIEQVPDLIISDIMMPNMDGYQLLNELRNNPLTDHIPIVLLTAKGDKESRLKGWHEKADEYLTKPFDADELNTRLFNLMGIREIIKQRFSGVALSMLDSIHPPAPSQNPSPEQKFVSKLDQVVETIYTDAQISIAQFAEKMAMSERQLFRKLKGVLNVTPAEYLRRFRLEKAKLLLSEGQTVSFVCFEVGFSSQSYFGKCFKAQYDISPGEFKKGLQADL